MNKIVVNGIAILISAFVLSLLVNSSYAQSTDNFKTYTDKDLGFSIQHPPNSKIEANPDNVRFRIMEKDDPYYDTLFSVNVEQIESHFDYDTMTVKNISLQQRVQDRIDLISRSPSIYTQIKQNEVTVGGNNGSKIEYTTPDRYAFEIYTIASGRFYILYYLEERLKVPETLPLANKMVESFKILK